MDFSKLWRIRRKTNSNQSTTRVHPSPAAQNAPSLQKSLSPTAGILQNIKIPQGKVTQEQRDRFYQKIEKEREKLISQYTQMLVKQKEHLVNDYNPDAIPPDFDLARDHKHARKIGPERKKTQRVKYCPCCARVVDRAELALNCDPTGFSFLGSGFPMYFSFIKYCLYILLTIFVTSGLYNMYSSVMLGQDCKEPAQMEDPQVGCVATWNTIISFGNKISQDDVIKTQMWLNFMCLWGVIIVLQLFRRQQRLLDEECDTSDISCQDFTIVVKNIRFDTSAGADAHKNQRGEEKDFDDELKQFLTEEITDRIKSKENKKIVDVTLMYKLDELYKLRDEKAAIIKEKQDALSYFYDNDRFEPNVSMSGIDQRLKKVERDIMALEDKYFEGKGHEFIHNYFAGVAFVSFMTETGREEVQNFYAPRLLNRNVIVFNDQPLEISEAPMPEDIKWDNFYLSDNFLMWRRIKGNGYIALSILLIFGTILGLNYVQITFLTANKDTPPVQALLFQIFSVIISLLQAFANSLLVILIDWTTNYESHRTQTDHSMSLSTKLAIAQFANTALVNFFLYLFLSTSDKDPYTKVFGMNGLADKQSFLFITNAAIPNIVSLVDIPYRLKLIERTLIESFRKDQVVYTQQQLNEMYVDPEFEIAVRYAQLVNYIFTVAFYSPILPVGILWTMVAILVQYWIDKFQLLRKRSVSCQLGNHLSLNMTELIEILLPIYSAMNIFFEYYIKRDLDYVSVATLACGVLHAVLPMQEFNECIFSIDESEANTTNFEQAYYSFQADYRRSNPATKRRAVKDFMDKKQQRMIDEKVAEFNKKINDFKLENLTEEAAPGEDEKKSSNGIEPHAAAAAGSLEADQKEALHSDTQLLGQDTPMTESVRVDLTKNTHQHAFEQRRKQLAFPKPTQSTRSDNFHKDGEQAPHAAESGAAMGVNDEEYEERKSESSLAGIVRANAHAQDRQDSARKDESAHALHQNQQILEQHQGDIGQSPVHDRQSPEASPYGQGAQEDPDAWRKDEQDQYLTPRAREQSGNFIIKEGEEQIKQFDNYEFEDGSGGEEGK